MYAKTIPKLSARLIRIEESDYGTFGILQFSTRSICLILEPRDLLNRQNVSSIPAQQYTCRRVDSPNHGETFEVTGVPGRSEVLFHPGNTAENTKGCLLPGSEFGIVNSKPAVLRSRKAFLRFMECLEGINEFRLTIVEHYA